MTASKELKNIIYEINYDAFIVPLPSELNADQVIIDCASLGMYTRALRGRKMRTLDRLYDEFSAACQFPLYFGENLMAFDECLSSLDNQIIETGIVLLMTEPDQILIDSNNPDDAIKSFLLSLIETAKEWGTEINLGEWWDRAALPFHILLSDTQEKINSTIANWTRIGNNSHWKSLGVQLQFRKYDSNEAYS